MTRISVPNSLKAWLIVWKSISCSVSKNYKTLRYFTHLECRFLVTYRIKISLCLSALEALNSRSGAQSKSLNVGSPAFIYYIFSKGKSYRVACGSDPFFWVRTAGPFDSAVFWVRAFFHVFANFMQILHCEFHVKEGSSE